MQVEALPIPFLFLEIKMNKAKKLVMKPQYRMRVVKSKKRYNRKKRDYFLATR